MGKDLSISILLDFYRDALTPKQAEAIDQYYNEDYSLSEIALNLQITRQGARDHIKRGEMRLYELEQTLSLASRFQEVQQGLQKVRELVCALEPSEKQKTALELIDEMIDYRM